MISAIFCCWKTGSSWKLCCSHCFRSRLGRTPRHSLRRRSLQWCWRKWRRLQRHILARRWHMPILYNPHHILDTLITYLLWIKIILQFRAKKLYRQLPGHCPILLTVVSLCFLYAIFCLFCTLSLLPVGFWVWIKIFWLYHYFLPFLDIVGW